MANVTTSGSKQGLSANDLDEIQEQLNFRFPESMRQFYLSHNGGVPHPNCFQLDDDYWQVNEFLPIKFGRKGSLFEDTYNRLVTEGQDFFPRDLVPFAVDPGGDVFCFRISSGDVGAIYCWVAENHATPETATVRLAESFESFLEQLVICPN